MAPQVQILAKLPQFPVAQHLNLRVYDLKTPGKC
jgi:hypothetical protein